MQAMTPRICIPDFGEFSFKVNAERKHSKILLRQLGTPVGYNQKGKQRRYTVSEHVIFSDEYALES